ncbi:MAG: hypothetical protein V1783_10070 [Bacteroidota bacterium]
MKKLVQRRFFLKGVFFLLAGFNLKKLFAFDLINQEAVRKKYSVNPAYSIKYSGESIFLETYLPDREIKRIEFGKIYSDILKMIINNKHPFDNIPQLAVKYSLADDYCAIKCDSILNKMEEEFIIITEETKVSITKSEINEQNR